MFHISILKEGGSVFKVKYILQSKACIWVCNSFSCAYLFIYLWLAEFQKGFEAKDL